MATVALGKRQYMLIGKIVATRYPDIAQNILQEELVPEPQETDLSLLDKFFVAFCQYSSVNPEEFRGSLNSRDKAELRCIYAGTMAYLYAPNAFHHSADVMAIRYGFIKEISRVLQINYVYTHRIVRQAIFRAKAYDDFKAKIDHSISQFKKMKP